MKNLLIPTTPSLEQRHVTTMSLLPDVRHLAHVEDLHVIVFAT